MSGKIVWVVKKAYNEYNHHRECFESVHATEASAIGSVPYVGRKGYEYEWYEIESVELIGD